MKWTVAINVNLKFNSLTFHWLVPDWHSKNNLHMWSLAFPKATLSTYITIAILEKFKFSMQNLNQKQIFVTVVLWPKNETSWPWVEKSKFPDVLLESWPILLKHLCFHKQLCFRKNYYCIVVILFSGMLKLGQWTKRIGLYGECYLTGWQK